MRYTLLCLLLVCYTFSYAQKIRFTDNNNWQTFGYPPSQYTFQLCDWAYVGTDTAGGNTYNVLKGAHVFYVGGSVLDTLGIYVLIREDTVHRIVYIRNTASTGDDTLFNYYWHVGDTRQTMGGAQTDTVLGIDSVLINGYYHRIFKMGIKEAVSHLNRRYSVIEGIGATLNPIYPVRLFVSFLQYTDTEYVYCFRTNGNTPFIMKPGIFSNSCLVSVDDISANEASIYPNPATEYLHIRARNKIQKMTIFDFSGRVVYSGKPGKSEENINVENWPSGIYTYNINNELYGRFTKL